MEFKYWLNYYQKFTGIEESLKGICMYAPQLDKISEKIRETFDGRLVSNEPETYKLDKGTVILRNKDPRICVGSNSMTDLRDLIFPDLHFFDLDGIALSFDPSKIIKKEE